MSVRIGSGFIQETRPLKRGESSEVRITDEYRPHIKAFLRTRRLLAENSPEGDSFRATARQQARALITSPENLTIILKGREVTSFPETWTVDAKCRKNRVDPELFFPVGSKGPAVAQAEEAKRICGDCPVRMPCLKTALDNKDEFGIWGGVWLENREELTPALKARLRTIRIEYPEVGAL